MHDKRYVWFLLFLGICIVNCEKQSDSQINASNTDSAKKQINVTLIEIGSNSSAKKSFEQHEMKHSEWKTCMY